MQRRLNFVPWALFVLLAAWAAPQFAHAADEPPEIPIWPAAVPGDADFKAPEKVQAQKNDGTLRVALVTAPSLTIYRPAADKANKTAVLICPGGGYNILAWDKEGTEVAQWLNTLGVTAAVLKYRVPRRPGEPHVGPLMDAQRAMRLMRQKAKELGVEKIGVLGFSAGGHLTVMTGTHYDETTYPKQDAADELSCKPDFLIPIYPAYLADEKQPGPLSPLVKVTKDTPPTFIAVTHDDSLRGLNSASFYIELKKAQVPAELHIFTVGGHGYGLRPSKNPVSHWPERCAEWMGQMGYLKAE